MVTDVVYTLTAGGPSVYSYIFILFLLALNLRLVYKIWWRWKDER